MGKDILLEDQTCPLCNGDGKLFYNQAKWPYHQCTQCSGIFMDRKSWPDHVEEKTRYEEHNNDVEDKRYQKFVSPITDAIQRDFTPNHVGLDFGAGSGPVITKVLTDSKFQLKMYDPFFHNFPDLLNHSYDYIASCEVIEHFHNPLKEFTLLKRLLNTNGKLYCMTHIYDSSIIFHDWYYKNDLTHVFIYHRDSIQWIKEYFGFRELSIQGKLITFSL